jgi:hypothetical protein
MKAGRSLSLALLGALLVQQVGCYATGSSTSRVREEVTGSRVIPSGTQVEFTEVAAGKSYLVTETPVCRKAVFGTSVPVTETYKTKQGKGSNGLVLVGIGGLQYLLGWTMAQASVSSSGGSGAAGAIPTVFKGMGIIMAGMGAALFLAPEHVTSTSEGDPRPLSRWDGPAVPCDSATPARVEAANVAFSAAYQKGPEPLVQLTRTGADGIATFSDRVPRLVQPFCGNATVTVSLLDGGVTTPDDSPASPFKARRAPASRTFSLPAGAGAPNLARLLEADTEAAALASACCRSNVAETARGACVETCAAAGGVSQCLSGLRACQGLASRSENPARATAVCAGLHQDCLAGRGTSPVNLANCQRICIDRRAERSCR